MKRRDLEKIGYTFSKRETSQAYQRNGNFGNPTRYYCWDVRCDGRLVRLRDAVKLANDYGADERDAG